MKKLHYCTVSGSIYKLPLRYMIYSWVAQSRTKPTSGCLIQSTMQRKKFLIQQGRTKQPLYLTARPKQCPVGCTRELVWRHKLGKV